jgi:hypothetical protein
MSQLPLNVSPARGKAGVRKLYLLINSSFSFSFSLVGVGP